MKTKKVKVVMGTRCQLCGSNDILRNRARTTFCNECHHCVTSRGNVSRMASHPEYKILKHRVYE